MRAGVVTRRFQKLRIAGGIVISSPTFARDTPASFFICALKALADPKYVPVRMPHVHLADAPRHVSGWESDVQPGSHALSCSI